MLLKSLRMAERISAEETYLVGLSCKEAGVKSDEHGKVGVKRNKDRIGIEKEKKKPFNHNPEFVKMELAEGMPNNDDGYCNSY
ncbi:hypothetical protein F8M41_004141 [Gigaspora margarita]|uniref:Uncharacterized protein n=1 Tax=Gigaspora margarita TaxID=4874 RepID=A0A8H3XD58_GIGMA|nr:hypothetical protein F8M41_004141 [Gigaspora margarita]